MKLTTTVLGNSLKRLLIILLLPIAAACSSTWDQDAAQEPIMINVMRLQLKPTTTEQFRTLHLLQTMPRQRADGMPWRLTTTDTFGNNFSVTISTPLANFAQLDSSTFTPTELGEALFGASVESRERVVVQTRPDMSIATDQEILPLRRMAYFQVRQGKIPEFEAFWINTVLPVMRARGIEGYQIFQNLIGGPQGQYLGALWIPNYAALDTLSMNTMLSAEQQTNFGNLVESYEIRVQQIDQELSFGFPGLPN